MRIQTKHKFIFVSTPKVCTHSVYKILDEHYSDGLIQQGFHSNEIPAKYHKYFRWTVCRNPYSRAASLWWSACRLHPPDIYGFRKGCGSADNFTVFIQWLSRTKIKDRVMEPLMMSQSEWLEPCEPIKALHVENLQEEISKLEFWKSGIKIPQLNTTKEKIKVQSEEEGKEIERPSLQELYQDPKAAEAVLRWAGEDFERFGYSTELEAL